MVTNEAKAKEIVSEICCETDYKDTAAYESAMAMARWKDEKYKLLLDAKDESIIQTEMDCNEMKKFLGWLNGTGLTVNEYAQLEAQYKDYINAKDIPTL